MSNFEPKISIIIPVYNGADYVQVAIESALDQTYNKIEVIVVNDGSTDDGRTQREIDKYKGEITSFYKENGGVSSALNWGIKKMGGDYCAWLSHDDVFTKNRVQNQLEWTREKGFDKDDILYADYRFIDQNGDEIDKESRVKEYFGETMLYQLFIGYPINGCTTLIHKDVFKKIGFFNEKLRYTQDYDFWFRCCFNEINFRFIDQKLLESRLHTSQTSRTENWNFRLDCDLMYSEYVAQVLKEQAFQTYLSPIKPIIRSFIERGYYAAASITAYSLKDNRSRDQLRFRAWAQPFIDKIERAFKIT